MHLVGGDDIREAAASVGANQHFCRGKISWNRMVTVVPQMRRNKDEGEDQRNHYIVMEATPLIRPEEIAFKNTAHKNAGPSTALPPVAPLRVAIDEIERRALQSFYL